ncbi:hypothetical protein HanLR1_Chr00c0739g0769591 [Helianthus annuus]|nr:hypothetical protein HanLR1_Chr00c0739g0769591 [Helianthus annuus]
MDDACRIYLVSELVPKKMKQNKLRETVQISIRKEIRTEALDTYAAIACQCGMENPDAHPQMARVVEELEKSLRLQGEEVQTLGNKNIMTIGEGVNDSLGGGKLDDVGEANGNEVTIASDISVSSNGEKNTGKVTCKTRSYETENLQNKFAFIHIYIMRINVHTKFQV